MSDGRIEVFSALVNQDLKYCKLQKVFDTVNIITIAYSPPKPKIIAQLINAVFSCHRTGFESTAEVQTYIMIAYRLHYQGEKFNVQGTKVQIPTLHFSLQR